MPLIGVRSEVLLATKRLTMYERSFVGVIRRRSAFVWGRESLVDAARLVELEEVQEQQLVYEVVRNEHRRLPKSNERRTNEETVALSDAPHRSQIASDRFRRKSDGIGG